MAGDNRKIDVYTSLLEDVHHDLLDEGLLNTVGRLGRINLRRGIDSTKSAATSIAQKAKRTRDTMSNVYNSVGASMYHDPIGRRVMQLPQNIGSAAMYGPEAAAHAAAAGLVDIDRLAKGRGGPGDLMKGEHAKLPPNPYVPDGVKSPRPGSFADKFGLPKFKRR